MRGRRSSLLGLRPRRQLIPIGAIAHVSSPPKCLAENAPPYRYPCPLSQPIFRRLRDRLDAFGAAVYFKLTRQLDDGSDDFARLRNRRQIADKGRVDLHLTKRHSVKFSEGGVPDAKIVDRKTDAMETKTRHAVDRGSAIQYCFAFDHLNYHIAWRYAALVQQRDEVIRKADVVEKPGGQVLRLRQISQPVAVRRLRCGRVW